MATTSERYYQAFFHKKADRAFGTPAGFYTYGKHYATEAEAREVAEGYPMRPVMVAEYTRNPHGWDEKVREVVIH